MEKNIDISDIITRLLVPRNQQPGAKVDLKPHEVQYARYFSYALS